MYTQLVRKIITRKRYYPENWTRPYFSQDSIDLSAKAASSSLWIFSQTFFQRCIQIIITAILARILFPEDFGLINMAGIIIGAIVLFGNIGFGPAIIHKREASQLHMSTAFWFDSGMSLILYFICILIGPLAKSYYNNVHIQSVIVIAALAILIDAPGRIYATILTKQIQFNKIAIIGFISEVTGRLIALISIVFFHTGYWGLVIGNLSTSCATVFLRYLYTRWYPLLTFDIQALKEMFHFGKNLFFQGFLNYFAGYVDYFVVGKRLGMESLGLYLFAYSIPHIILREFSLVLMRILFPVLCKVSDDNERFNRGYLKAVKFISLVSFPVCIGLFSVGDHLINVLYGERWVRAVVPFQILCFSGMAKSILTTMGAVFMAKGRPDIELKWNLIRFPIVATCVYLGSYYGLIGVALAMTLTAYLSFIAMWICLRLTGIKFISYLHALLPAFLGSVLILLVVLPVNIFVLPKYGLAHLSSLLILTFIGASFYLMYILLLQRDAAVELFEFIKGGIKRK